MTLAPVHLLTGVVPVRSAGFGGLHALAIDDGGLAAGALTVSQEQMVVDPFPRALAPQAGEPAVDRFSGGKLLGTIRRGKPARTASCPPRRRQIGGRQARNGRGVPLRRPRASALRTPPRSDHWHGRWSRLCLRTSPWPSSPKYYGAGSRQLLSVGRPDPSCESATFCGPLLRRSRGGAIMRSGGVLAE
jgi:hypothetical protein